MTELEEQQKKFPEGKYVFYKGLKTKVLSPPGSDNQTAILWAGVAKYVLTKDLTLGVECKCCEGLGYIPEDKQ